MAFSERLYASLDVDLCHVCLHEPLSHIVSQPLVYVQDMIPQLCYDAIMALDNVRRYYSSVIPCCIMYYADR
jgi:hypothetical protein